MKKLPVVLVCFLAAVPVQASPLQTDVSADAAKCQGCHQANGPDTVPRLNGLRADYILTRLWEFHDPTTQTPHATDVMWDIATNIGSAKARALADYFAMQAPTPARTGDKTAGRKAFQELGCQSCHGPEGEGTQKAPRLAGQHTLYLHQQIAAFKVGVRYHPAMLPNTWTLKPEQIDVLAAYLGSD